MQSLLLLITNLWLVFVSIKVVKKNTENMFESFMYCNVLVLFLIPKKEQMEWLLKEQFDQ